MLGHEQRLQRGRPRARLRVTVADEQVRRDRRQLPEREQPDQVVGPHQAEHRPGEEREQTDEASDAVATRREVAAP